VLHSRPHALCSTIITGMPQHPEQPMEESLLAADPNQPPVVRPGGSLSEHFFPDEPENGKGDPEMAQLPPAAAAAQQHEAKSSVFGSVMNLSNTILGAGALAMPFACAQTGIALFVVLLLTIAMGAHAAIRMLALCVDKHAMEDGRYASLGGKAFGKAGSTFGMVAVALQQLGPCVIYIQICADILVPILCEVYPEIVHMDTAGCNDDSALRMQLQLVVIATLMLPLSMIKSMDTLKFGSTLSMFFMSMFAVLVVIRGVWTLRDPGLREADFRVRCPDQTMSDPPHARLTGNDAHVPTPDCGHGGPGDEIEWLWAQDGNLLKAIPIICFAFLCHPNMFPIYQKLNGASHQRMATVSRCSIMLSVTVYLIVGIFGYLTFLRRAQTEADLLNLYDVGTGTWFATALLGSRVSKNGLFEPFSYKNEHFTKTGSGQTLGKHSKKTTVFLAGAERRRCEKRHLVLSFPYVCPEPVLAK
jgi:sodium-coupled neutral amino acid transporter 2